MATPLAAFGPGILICTRTDAQGTPINVGYAQEFSIDLAGTTKQLFGQNQFPLVAARSTIKATGKFKAATVSGTALNQAFFGQTISTSGMIAWVVGSTHTVGGTSTSFSTGNFDTDLGITYSTTGIPFQRLSTGSSPAAGQYTVSNASGTETYTFAAGDSGANLKVTYTTTTATGSNLLVTNQPIGFSPTFQLDYYTNLNQPTAKPFVVRCYQAIASKAAMAFKLEDFMMPEFDFDLFANNAGQLANFVFPEYA